MPTAVSLIPWDIIDDLVAWEQGIMPAQVSVEVYRRLKADGISIGELARVLGIERSTLSNILARRYGTRPEIATKVKAWCVGALPEAKGIRRQPVQYQLALEIPTVAADSARSRNRRLA